MSDPPAARLTPPAILSAGAAAAILAALPGARAVGGLVRDAVAKPNNGAPSPGGNSAPSQGSISAPSQGSISAPSHDIDIAAPLPPQAIATRLRAAGLRVFETGMAHGTVTAVLDHQPVEVTSLRRDMATDGRHAEVEWTTDWREDAARRDFTINAMSMAADGRLWDYFSGREDLVAGRVRFVGDPATRLREDYLRALRFFRFQARYGRGAPDPAAIAAIRDAVPGLARLSPERVWMELKRLLAAPDPLAAVALMAETGVLGAVLPESNDLTTFRGLVASGAPADPLLRLATLLPQGFPGMCSLAERLRLSGEERDRLVDLRSMRLPTPEMPDAELRRLLADGDHRSVLDRAWLAQALLPGEGWDALRARIDALPRPVFPVQGRDALALGELPGPRVGELLARLRDWWLAGGCVADREACVARLRELAATGPV